MSQQKRKLGMDSAEQVIANTQIKNQGGAQNILIDQNQMQRQVSNVNPSSNDQSHGGQQMLNVAQKNGPGRRSSKPGHASS